MFKLYRRMSTPIAYDKLSNAQQVHIRQRFLRIMFDDVPYEDISSYLCASYWSKIIVGTFPQNKQLILKLRFALVRMITIIRNVYACSYFQAERKVWHNFVRNVNKGGK